MYMGVVWYFLLAYTIACVLTAEKVALSPSESINSQ